MGRAGRDGSEAQCALFLDDLDYRRLRSLAHSDGVGAPAVKRFLTAAFADPPQLPVAKVKGKSKVAEAAQKAAVAAAAEAAAMAAIEGPQYRVLEAKRLTAELDMKEEVMETLCSHLEVRVHSSHIRDSRSWGQKYIKFTRIYTAHRWVWTL